MAERVGFEPTRPLRVAVFETAPLSHSGTSPWQLNVKFPIATENDPTRAGARKLGLILP